MYTNNLLSVTVENKKNKKREFKAQLKKVKNFSI